MEKYGFVYIWFDRKHKRYYIGAHWGFENDGYICSSPWMLKAYRRRPKDFKRKILQRIYSSRKETFLMEEKYLKMIKPEEIKTKYYNLNTKVSDYWHNYEQVRMTVGQKISASRTGKTYSKRGPRSEETKQKIREKLLGKSLSPENIAKRIATVTGTKRNQYKKHDKIICPHCNKSGGIGAMKRLHFNNCKEIDNGI